MRIEITCEQLSRAEKLLHGIPDAVPKVTANAMNRGIQTLEAEANRQIRKRYAISPKNMRKYQKRTKKRAVWNGGSTASIEISGPKIPLHKYTANPSVRTYTTEKTPVEIEDAVWKIVNKHAKVSAMDSKESGMVARPAAFIATFKSGHTGIFKRAGGRTGSGKEKIKEYWGYSVAEMLDYEPAKLEIAEKVQETVNKRLEHEIGRILSSY